jgi:Transcription factor WhiB
LRAASFSHHPCTKSFLERGADTGADARKDVADQRWRRHAACAGVDPAVFAIERGQSAEPAFAYCRGCTVRVECLEHALDLGSKAFGIWGNTTRPDTAPREPARHVGGGGARRGRPARVMVTPA